jgi:hypothetical protein
LIPTSAAKLSDTMSQANATGNFTDNNLAGGAHSELITDPFSLAFKRR